MTPDNKRKLIATVAFGLMGGLLFIAIISGDLKTAFICGAIIGLVFLAWIFYFLGSGLSRAKRFAQEAIDTGQISDRAKAGRVVAFLNLQGETESKYLLVKLKELLEKK